MSADETIAPWVAVQKKTFTKWTNSHLKKVGASIEDVQTEFDNGIKLMQLVKALYGLDIPKYNANPKMRPHKLDNLSLAFQMVENAKIKTNFLKTTHLIDHDLKMILGMIWAIILDYQIKGISVEDLSAKEALLLWCQKKTKGYKDVAVKDFSGSWRDGLALAALIHHHRPDLIDFDSLNKDDHRTNLQLCFDVAKNSLGIDPLLEVEDVDVERPDDKSVMTYISEFYHKFTAGNQKETAARRIHKFATFNKSSEEMANNYTTAAQQLLDWINEQIQVLSDRNFDNDMSSVKNLIEGHKNWKLDEKTKKNDQKLDNEVLHTNIQARLRANKRKNWVAPEGLTIEDVDVAWERLGEAEKDRGKALRDHLNKQKDGLRKQYADAASEFYDYVSGLKKNVAESGNQGDLNDQLSYLKEQESALNNNEKAEQLQELYKSLEELGLADENPYTDFTLEELLLLLESVKNLLKKKKQAIQNQLASSASGSGLSDDQIEDLKETFRHFDKDRNNTLDKLELKSCLQTLGYTYTDEAFNKLFNELSNGGENVDLDAFLKYMIGLMQDTDDANQIKQSFRTLANDKSTVTTNDLRVHPLEDEQINFLSGHMEGTPDFDYNGYTESVFA